MMRHCGACRNEYAMKPPEQGGGGNEDRPHFLALPPWFQRTPAATRAVWQYVAIIHAFYLLFLPLLLDEGALSTPGTCYALTILLYFGIRYHFARLRGYPILTRFQTVALLLLPFWGLAGSAMLFHLAQYVKAGGHW
jgi:hypothetical protein